MDAYSFNAKLAEKLNKTRISKFKWVPYPDLNSEQDEQGGSLEVDEEGSVLTNDIYNAK